MSTRIQVCLGDVRDVSVETVDGVIATVGSDLMCHTGVSTQIRNVSGEAFHSQLRELKLEDGMVITATGGPFGNGRFKNVIFVIDDGDQPPWRLLLAAFEIADLKGMKSVVVPLNMTGKINPDSGLGLLDIADGICKFTADNPMFVSDIIVAVGENLEAGRRLGKMIWERRWPNKPYNPVMK